MAVADWDRAVEGDYYATEAKAEAARLRATQWGGVASGIQRMRDGTWCAVIVLSHTERHWADHYRGWGVHVLVPVERPAELEWPTAAMMEAARG